MGHRIEIRILLTTGESHTQAIGVEQGEPETVAIMRFGSRLRRKDPRVAKIDWIGQKFGWIGHATEEQRKAIAADERIIMASESLS